LQEENIAGAGINTVICLSFEEGGTVLAGLCWGWTGGDLIEIEIRYHDAHARL
jgi:hypothetical protein